MTKETFENQTITVKWLSVIALIFFIGGGIWTAGNWYANTISRHQGFDNADDRIIARIVALEHKVAACQQRATVKDLEYVALKTQLDSVKTIVVEIKNKLPMTYTIP